jgi:hypothetical protein
MINENDCLFTSKDGSVEGWVGARRANFDNVFGVDDHHFSWTDLRQFSPTIYPPLVSSIDQLSD